MKLISWNYKGIGNKINPRIMRDILRLEKPTIFLLKETKVKESDMADLNSKQHKHSNSVVVNCRGE